MTAKPEPPKRARGWPYRVERDGTNRRALMGPSGEVTGWIGSPDATAAEAARWCARLNAAHAAGRADGEALAVALEEIATRLQGRCEPNSNHESAFRIARAALARWRQSSGGGR